MNENTNNVAAEAVEVVGNVSKDYSNLKAIGLGFGAAILAAVVFEGGRRLVVRTYKHVTEKRVEQNDNYENDAFDNYDEQVNEIHNETTK